MSWSVSAVGKPGAVAGKLADDFERINYLAEPERSIKNAAAAIIAETLLSFGPNYAVRVNASGSQSSSDGKVQHNTLKIEVEPIYGFVE